MCLFIIHLLITIGIKSEISKAGHLYVAFLKRLEETVYNIDNIMSTKFKVNNDNNGIWGR